MLSKVRTIFFEFSLKFNIDKRKTEDDYNRKCHKNESEELPYLIELRPHLN